ACFAPPRRPPSCPPRRSSDLAFAQRLVPRFVDQVWQVAVLPCDRHEEALGLLGIAAMGVPVDDDVEAVGHRGLDHRAGLGELAVDRKSTRLNSSHVKISYAVF